MPNQNDRLSLKFKNNGPLNDLTINFGKKLNPEKANIHIIVGENGSGKSTVLKTLFYELYENKTSLLSPNNDNFFKGLDILNNDISKSEQYLIAQASFRGWLGSGVYYYTPNEPLISTDSSNRTVRVKNLDHGNNLIPSWVCSYNPVGYLEFIENLENQRNALIANPLKPKSEQLIEQEIHEIEIKLRLTEFLESFIKTVYDKDFSYKWKGGVFSKYLPFFDGEHFEFNELSLGYRQIVSLITDILMKVWNSFDGDEREKSRFILLLDEIDIHLHPKAQRKILPALQKMFPNAEIFCTTHSPFVVNSVSEAWIYELSKENYEKKDGQHILNPKISSDGNSFYNVLISDFNLSERFGKDIEDLLEKLRQFIIKVKKKTQDKDDAEAWNKIIVPLATRPNEEIKQILAFELTNIGISTEKIISLWQK